MSENSLEATVFVVEDDEAMRDSIFWLLDSMNLRTRIFSSANDFLATCDMRREGCLLLDVRMPGMSGMELLERLKENGCHLPVIIITGLSDDLMAANALGQGVFDFIQKPFSGQELLDRVNAALRQNLKCNCDMKAQVEPPRL
ncbi:MAG: response regulator transcription factor [Sulfuricella sp.]